jgi:hypothetical protein
MTESLSQISLFAAMVSMLEKRFGTAFTNERQANVLIHAATDICAAMQNDVGVSAGMGLTAWLASDRTGLSSKYMAHVLTGKTLGAKYAHPHDPSDFGRCLGLLEAVPAFRDRLSMMSAESGEWDRLVHSWYEIERLYREELPSGRAPKCFEKMRKLLGE